MVRDYKTDGPIIDGHVYDLKNPRRTGAPHPRHNPFHQAGRISSQPTTMPDLNKRTGAYFNRAKVHLEWSAISAWMMKGEATAVLEAAGIPYDVASLSARLAGDAKRHEAGWPTSISGQPVTPALYDLSPDCQQEARRTANEVHRVWKAQGYPHLSAKLIEQVYLHLAHAVRNGLLEPIPGLSADPTPPANFKPPMSIEFLDRLGDLMKAQS